MEQEEYESKFIWVVISYSRLAARVCFYLVSVVIEFDLQAHKYVLQWL
jgi:hypothetical protein